MSVPELPEGPFKTYNQLKCPYCSVKISFGTSVDVVGNDVECVSCHKKFSFEDGFVENIADIPIHVLKLLGLRLGMMQLGSTEIHVGEMVRVKFKKPFFKVSGVFLLGPEDVCVAPDTMETEDYVIVAAHPTKEGFHLLSSGKSPHRDVVTVLWIATGTESDREVPLWHIFLQTSVDLLNKEEYSTVIVMAMMTFDCYLDRLLADTLCSKHGLAEDLANRIVMSPKFGRDEFLGYWLKNLFGKSFTEECDLNEKLKGYGEMRNRIVHPSKDGFDEQNLTLERAEDCIGVVIKSIKWVNDLKLGKL